MGIRDSESPVSIPTAGYRSVFDDYKPLRDEALQDWRQANDAMGRLQGHMGHLDAETPTPAETHQHLKAGSETTPGESR